MEKIDRLFVPSKQEYAKGNRPNVKCILCAIIEKNPGVELLDIHRSNNFVVSANLFPYNPGHLMIFPIKHIESITPLTSDEVVELHQLQLLSLKILNQYYNAQGFNVGYNLGSVSGASISHLHLHIVPRYQREVGFIDVIGSARIIVEDPRDTVKKLTKAFQECKI
jgi:ATP adenylyltransferase